jgi:hypothetical protein
MNGGGAAAAAADADAGSPVRVRRGAPLTLPVSPEHPDSMSPEHREHFSPVGSSSAQRIRCCPHCTRRQVDEKLALHMRMKVEDGFLQKHCKTCPCADGLWTEACLKASVHRRRAQRTCTHRGAGLAAAHCRNACVSLLVSRSLCSLCARSLWSIQDDWAAASSWVSGVLSWGRWWIK